MALHLQKMKRALLYGFLVAVFLMVNGALGFAEPVAVTEWKVPWENTRPRDPFVSPGGEVWFCGQKGGYLAYLKPESGEFKKFDLGQGAGPHNLIVDAHGSVWFAGNRNGFIGRMDLVSGNIQRFTMPDRAAGDPHTLVFGREDAIWFTVQQGNFVGRLQRDTGDIDLVKVPTPHARPYGVDVDSEGRPWVALFGSNKIATVSPQTLKLVEYELPRKEARPRRLVADSQGAVWYVDYAHGFLGRFVPTDNTFKEWPMPGGDASAPYALAIDDRDRLWMVETGSIPNRLVGFDPLNEAFFSITDLPAEGGTVRHMVFHPSTRTLWFGEDTNYIGRARIP